MQIIDQVVVVITASLVVPTQKSLIHTTDITSYQRESKPRHSRVRNVSMDFVPMLYTAEINALVRAIRLAEE